MDRPPTPYRTKRNISLAPEGENPGLNYSCAGAAWHQGSGPELDTKSFRPRREAFVFVAG